MKVDVIYQAALVVGWLSHKLLEATLSQALCKEVSRVAQQVNVEVSCYNLGSGTVEERQNVRSEVFQIGVATESVYVDYVEGLEGKLDEGAVWGLVGTVVNG